MCQNQFAWKSCFIWHSHNGDQTKWCIWMNNEWSKRVRFFYIETNIFFVQTNKSEKKTASGLIWFSTKTDSLSKVIFLVTKKFVHFEENFIETNDDILGGKLCWKWFGVWCEVFAWMFCCVIGSKCEIPLWQSRIVCHGGSGMCKHAIHYAWPCTCSVFHSGLSTFMQGAHWTSPANRSLHANKFWYLHIMCVWKHCLVLLSECTAQLCQSPWTLMLVFWHCDIRTGISTSISGSCIIVVHKVTG